MTRQEVRRKEPLAGRRILITRPRAQSRSLADRLRRQGAKTVAVPTIGIVAPKAGGPLDLALRRITQYDWIIVTSANGARACLDRARALGVDLAAARGTRWAAIGPATARILRGVGIAAVTPSRYLSEAIARDLDAIRGRRILLPRTDAASPVLADALRSRGAIVTEITAYRTVLAPPGSRARIRRLITARQVDTVTFTSASTVHGLVRLLGNEREALRAMVIACIGPVTAAAVIEEGFRPMLVADEHTMEGLVRALVAHHGAPEDSTTYSKGDRHARNRAAR